MEPDPENPQRSGPDNSGPKERKCRYCKAVKKPHVAWPDPDYCSGKCRKDDGAPPLPQKKPVEPVEVAVKETGNSKASLADYTRHPEKYRRRFNPDKLNWGELLTSKQLKQAGFRANREPIPGDWDYTVAAPEGAEVAKVGKEDEDV